MKTTDLIPILLYHLKDGDKYGLELINACSACSDGQITVKQPTLYSILKKLEKSKFISSYWQDSDIGGKRHYFKITENGLSQLETYPPLEDLIKLAISNDEAIEVAEEKDVEQQPEKSISPSPFDNFSIEKPATVENKKENVFDKLFVSDDKSSENLEEKEILEQDCETLTETQETSEAEENFSPVFAEDEAMVLPENEAYSADVSEESVVSSETDAYSADVSEELVDLSENEVNLADKIEEDNTIDESENFEVLPNTSLEIDNIEESVENQVVEEVKEENTTNPTTSFSVFDALDFGDSQDEEYEQNDETTSPIENAFELKNPFFKNSQEKSLEEKTNLEINEENTKLLTKDYKSEDFANNVSVSTFTQKNVKPVDTSKDIANLFTQELKSPSPIKYETEDEIKYQDYVDIKNDKTVRKVIKTSNRRLYKVISSSLLSLITILLCFFTVLKSGFTAIFAVFSIASALYVLYYACNFIGKFKDHHYSLGENFIYPFKKKLLVRTVLFVILIGATFIINLILNYKLFAFSNFGNLLAPIIICSLLYIDYILSLIFYRKI